MRQFVDAAEAGYLFGSRVVDEFQEVLQRISSASASIHSELQGSEFGSFMLEHFGKFDSATTFIFRFLKISSSLLEAVVITFICAVYLTAQPQIYRTGLIWLFPPQSHPS